MWHIKFNEINTPVAFVQIRIITTTIKDNNNETSVRVQDHILIYILEYMYGKKNTSRYCPSQFSKLWKNDLNSRWNKNISNRDIFVDAGIFMMKRK